MPEQSYKMNAETIAIIRDSGSTVMIPPGALVTLLKTERVFGIVEKGLHGIESP